MSLYYNLKNKKVKNKTVKRKFTVIRNDLYFSQFHKTNKKKSRTKIWNVRID